MLETIEVNTSELTGTALDWAVAVAEFGKVFVYPDGGLRPPAGTISMNDDDGTLWTNIGDFHHGPQWAPSDSWSQGGLLIDKHLLSLKMTGTETWAAIVEGCNGIGPTPLIAACRAIVAAKLGDVVSVPAELA